MAALAGIVSSLEPQLGRSDGKPVPLEGGITNRNYRVRFGTGEYMVRLPGKDTALLGISRPAERLANETAAALGIAPEVAAGNEHCLVTRFLPCRPLDPEALRRTPEPVARALRAFHDSGVQLPARFWVPELLEDWAATVRERGGELPASYAPTQALAARIAQALPLSAPAPCHDDLLPTNLIAVDRTAADPQHGARSASPEWMLVDWEYAGMGHRFFDLGNLAVNNEFDEVAELKLLAAYLRAEPSPGQRAALRLMKVMSDAREAAWGVIQGVISELEFDFGAYAERHFERLLGAAGDTRFEGWLDAAAA
jgi:thiamine kinase-like enzyme